jgi:phosphopantetheinyl transferase (holo-ACP synthase)
MPVGHDLVWLRAARCKGRAGDARFLQKVCTAAEQQYIAGAPDADAALWMIWSAKEAAYKLSCFAGNRGKFLWQQFDVRAGAWADTVQSIVVFGDASFYCQSFISKETIVSIAVKEPALYASLLYKKIKTNNATSAALHAYASATIAAHTRPASSLRIIKNEYGIPWLTGGALAQPVPISLSHDGPYLSFAVVVSEKFAVINTND